MRCEGCGDLDPKGTRDGYCSTCYPILAKCDRCGGDGPTVPMKMIDGDDLGLPTISRFCSRCAATDASNYMPVIE